MPALVAGEFGSAFKFDGMLNIRIADAQDLDSPSFTIAYWQNLASLPASTITGYECPVNRPFDGSSDGSSDNSWQVCPSAAGMFYKVGETSNTNTTAMVGVGEWHHIAITFEAVAGAFTIWLDGVSIGSGTATVQIDPADPIVLGMDLDNNGTGTLVPSAPFDGALDDLRFYNRALSAGEVLALATRM
jgi:hypothetical protein